MAVRRELFQSSVQVYVRNFRIATDSRCGKNRLMTFLTATLTLLHALLYHPSASVLTPNGFAHCKLSTVLALGRYSSPTNPLYPRSSSIESTDQSRCPQPGSCRFRRPRPMRRVRQQVFLHVSAVEQLSPPHRWYRSSSTAIGRVDGLNHTQCRLRVWYEVARKGWD